MDIISICRYLVILCPVEQTLHQNKPPVRSNITSLTCAGQEMDYLHMASKQEMESEPLGQYPTNLVEGGGVKTLTD